MFKVAPLGSGQTFTLVAPELSVPGIFLKCCDVFSLKPTRPMCDGRFFRLLAFVPLGESSRPFLRLPFPMGSTRGSLFDSQGNRS